MEHKHTEMIKEYRVPFYAIMLEAKRSTGYNRPTRDVFIKQGLNHPAIQHRICIEAHRVCGLADNDEIADDDVEHYTAHELIEQAVIQMYEQYLNDQRI